MKKQRKQPVWLSVLFRTLPSIWKGQGTNDHIWEAKPPLSLVGHSSSFGLHEIKIPTNKLGGRMEKLFSNIGV